MAATALKSNPRLLERKYRHDCRDRGACLLEKILRSLRFPGDKNAEWVGAGKPWKTISLGSEITC